MSKQIRVCHLTSLHPPFDVRIFHKECVSLAEAGFDVRLVAPIEHRTVKNNVIVVPVELPHNKIWRMISAQFNMLVVALHQRATVYHFHDPELLPCGVMLKMFGKKVIYDVHENMHVSIMSKRWIPKPFRRIVSAIYKVIEWFSILFFDHLILAEESYLKYYQHAKSTVVLNYPLPSATQPKPRTYGNPFKFVYVGAVEVERGALEMVELIGHLNTNGYESTIDIVGKIWDKSLKVKMLKMARQYNIENKVNIVGKVDFEQVEQYIDNAQIGLAMLYPIPNYYESLPTKIFEYMQRGLPVVLSNFPLYKQYVEESETGICVDVQSHCITTQVIEMLDNVSRLSEYGQNGVRAVAEKYNWNTQADKLISAYKDLLK